MEKRTITEMTNSMNRGERIEATKSRSNNLAYFENQ